MQKKKFFTFSAGGDQFSKMRPLSTASTSTQESCRQEQQLSSRVVQRERLFFFFGNQKSRICEEEKYFETKIKRKSFSMEQWKGKDTDETRIAAEPKDDVLVFQQRSRKKDGLFGNPNPKHVKEPTKQLFV